MYLARKPFLLSALAFSLTLPCLAQEDLLEKFSQQEQESDTASESWLQELLNAPRDLNRSSAAELQRLPFLTHSQINAFLAQRNREIYFTNLEAALLALQVRGDTLAFCRTIFIISPPPTVHTNPAWSATVRTRSGVPATIEANWLGPEHRLYHRVQSAYGAFHLGALTERDPGEVQWNDHRVWYVEWQPARNRVLVGNFQAEWGLGLAQWGPYAATITSEVHAASHRWGRGLVPYLSTNESAGYKGVAASHEGRHWATFAFISSNPRDVTLRDNQIVVGYRTSGYHRTASEIAQRDNLRERTSGAALQYRFGAGRELGFMYHSVRFSRAWQVDNRRESFFDFIGTRNEVFSLAGAWQWTKSALSFEIAQSRSQGKAAALTLSIQEEWLSWTLALFHADRNFHSPHGRSLAESDSPIQAESGYALGLTWQPHAHVRGEFFYQREQSLWRTNTLPLPPQARHAGAQIEFKILPDLRMRWRYTFAENERLETVFGQILQTRHGIERWRGELEQKLSARLRLRPRVDVVRPRKSGLVTATPSTSQQNTVGMALSLELLWQISSKVTLNVRQSHYDSALPIYQYERDLPGVFTVVALRERGIRRYIYGHLKLHPNFSLAGKISFREPERDTASARSSLAWGLQFDWAIR